LAHEFLSFKNTFGNLLTFFDISDLHITQDGELLTRRYFSIKVGCAKKRLDTLGFTLEKARETFELSKRDMIEFLYEYKKCGNSSTDQLELEFTFEKWCIAAQHFALVLSRDVFNSKCKYVELERQRVFPHSIPEKIVLQSLPFNQDRTFFGISVEYASLEIFRVLLEAFSDEQEIILDYTSLHEGGWCNATPEEELHDAPKTIILTEGKYDAFVISKAMHLLYPYMEKFYSFVDSSSANVQGSTNFLTHYLKVFIGAKVENRIIALYDNDAAGLSEIESLKSIKLPENVRIMHLPDLTICNAYPTIGPTVNEAANINGRACSIELFLGNDVLSIDGSLTPIMWTGYIDKVKNYQGEITRKGEIQKKFVKKLQDAEDGEIKNNGDWNELNVLLNSIFAVFK